MFCVLCMSLKAEAGAYLPGKIGRVCLECYQETIGSLPLPSSAGNALGGKFADPKKLLGALQSEGKKQFSGLMKDFSGDLVSAVQNGNLSGLPSRFSGEIKEARAAAQEKLTGGLESLKDKLADKKDDIEDALRDKADDAKDKLKAKAGKFFQKLF